MQRNLALGIETFEALALLFGETQGGRRKRKRRRGKRRRRKKRAAFLLAHLTPPPPPPFLLFLSQFSWTVGFNGKVKKKNKIGGKNR